MSAVLANLRQVFSGLSAELSTLRQGARARMTATTNSSPNEGQIRWVELRLGERIAFDQGQFPEWTGLQSDQPRKNLEVWLAKERDGLSWQQIVIKHFPEYLRQGGPGKIAGISKARRVFETVKRELDPTPDETLRDWLNGKIEEVFGVRPQVFKKYLDSLRIERPEKKLTKKGLRGNATRVRKTK
jgi:hypothetical protein